MWGIIDQLSKTDVDEINIDANASWKPNMPKMAAVKEEDSKGKWLAIAVQYAIYF